MNSLCGPCPFCRVCEGVQQCMRHCGSPMVQCSPVQPWWQSHLPSRQTPWSMQRGWQSLCSHSGPVQPSSHWHTPLMHDPWGPQSTTHTSVEKEKATETCRFCSVKKKKALFFCITLVQFCILCRGICHCWKKQTKKSSDGCCKVLTLLAKVGQ